MDYFPYYTRGLIFYNQGEISLAMQDFNKSTELNSNYAHPYYMRGRIYSQLEEIGKAKKEFVKAIELNPNHVYSLNSLAKLLLENKGVRLNKDTQKALELALRAVKFSEEKVPSYLDTLAAAYSNLGQYEKAVETQSKAIKKLEMRKLNFRNKIYHFFYRVKLEYYSLQLIYSRA
jgi:tetratricopeptide (TPR) repeat protein